MSAPAAPIIPPRPTRIQQAVAHGADKLPEMPPHPIHKRVDRSVSPGNYPRSPFNEPYNPMLSMTRATVDATVGQEGMEYAEVQYEPNQPISGLVADAGAQTRGIDKDLKLHAPKPSLPKSSATAQVQAVTRTDSHQAAAHGIGKVEPLSEDHEPRVRSRASFSRPGSSFSTDRRLSAGYGDDLPVHETGIRVPINPHLGDVQAPSPAPYGLSPHHTGQSGDGKRKSVHGHSKVRDMHLPPGSYGLHGHGVLPPDKFERDWYAKHPDQLQHEEGHGHGVYESIGSGRGSFALSSDNLNKIVRDTASRGAGFGTAAGTLAYPDEQIGYLASETFISRSQGATPVSLTKTITNASQPALESPLRKSEFSAQDGVGSETRTERAGSEHSDRGAKSDIEDAVHVDEPKRRYNKIAGGQETIDETSEVRPYITHSTDDGDVLHGHGYSVPILASDEVAKEIGGEHLHPAISPKQDRRSSQHEYEHRSGDATPSSRPGSRPSSIYGLHSASHSLSRFISHHDDRETLHTPLEDVDEYEPLFPDEDGKSKSINATERFKARPDTLRQRFPSQDIWEDTPSSAMYEATVSTPDLPSQIGDMSRSTTFEHPDVEAARKGEPSEDERKKLVPNDERLAKSKFAPHLRDDMPTRPGMAPRFPSNDVWEDSPDSSYLVTTVSSPPVEDQPETSIAPATKPAIPPRPIAKSRLGEGATSTQIAPTIPTRPPKHTHAVPPVDSQLTDDFKSVAKDGTPSPTELKKVPSIPDRPKPQIPARPVKQLSGDSLSKSVTGEPTEIVDANQGMVTKDKPVIPPRPIVGGKFANLRGNFMNDLNQKLGVGPPKEKEPEPEAVTEVKPLEDARKGRARGPQRRAPAKSPSAAAEQTSSFAMCQPRSLWHIDNSDGNLNVHGHEKSTKPIEESTHEHHSAITREAPAPASSGLSTNTAGEPTDPSSQMVAQSKLVSMHQPDSDDDLHMSKATTASTDAFSEHPLAKEISDPNKDAIPASQQTTASDISGTTLAPSETRAPVETNKIGHE